MSSDKRRGIELTLEQKAFSAADASISGALVFCLSVTQASGAGCLALIWIPGFLLISPPRRDETRDTFTRDA